MNIKRYQDINVFLSETKPTLEERELLNTFVITSALVIQSKDTPPNFYCGVVYNGPDFVMTMVCLEGDFLYASSIYDETKSQQALSMMIDDVLQSGIVMKGIHAFQPMLNEMRDLFETQSENKFEPENKVWCCMVDRSFKWQTKIAEQAQGGKLRMATIEEDLALIEKWSAQFIMDLSEEHHMQPIDTQALSRCTILDKSVYLWCNAEGIPVSMAWKRRPLQKGCSMAYVFTPKEYRRRGLGGVVVSALTEHLLKSYEYVTLLVSGQRDPRNNLYTRVGYQWVGEAGRLELLSNSSK